MITEVFLEKYNNINRGYAYKEKGGLGFFCFPAFLNMDFINHGFSARIGGISKPPYTSLNLSFSREREKRETVIENFKLLALNGGFPFKSMVMDNFEHGVNVIEVNRTHRGAGYIKANLPHCDGLITKDTGTTLITGHADCVPLFAVDSAKGAIGLAHAGWKGTLGKIGLNMIELMVKNFGSNPKDILAGVGPCICGNCFEVDEALALQFKVAYPNVPLSKPGKPNKAMLDLVMASVSQFLDGGIPAGNISVMDICTFENPDLLFSYRRDNKDAGGMCAFIQLKEDVNKAFLQFSKSRVKV